MFNPLVTEHPVSHSPRGTTIGAVAAIRSPAHTSVATLPNKSQVFMALGNQITEEASEYFASVINNNSKLKLLLLGNDNMVKE